MKKIRTTINLTIHQKELLKYHYIDALHRGIPRSYSDLIGEAIERCYVKKAE